MKVTGVIQCRMTSSRLPGKALMDLAGLPVLRWVVERARLASGLDALVLATSDGPEDDPLAEAGRELGVDVVRGSLDNLPSRYLLALERHPADAVVRITADNPLTCPELVDAAVQWYGEQELDWCYNGAAPVGMGVDVFAAEHVRTLACGAVEPRHLEHMVTWFLDNHLSRRIGCPPLDVVLRRPEVRVTLDTADDLRVLQDVFSRLDDPLRAGVIDVIRASDEAER